MSAHHLFDRGRQFAALALILFFSTYARGQSERTNWDKITSQSKPEEIVTALWKTILTPCRMPNGDIAYFYAGLPRRNRTIYQYRKADFPRLEITQERLSTADQLNGIEWRFTAKWHAGAYSYLSFN